MKTCFTRIALFFSLTVLCPAQEMKLPVFFLRYDGGTGSEEITTEEEEEAEVKPSSQRHKVTLRIKEQWNDGFTTNLYTAVSRKEYFLQAGSYTYFYLNPDFAWDVTDRLQWSSSLRTKWTFYDEPDSEGDLKDFTSLSARSELSVKLMDDLKLIPFFQGVFDLGRETADNQQTYTAGLGLESKLDRHTRLSGRYRSIVRTALGGGSEVAERFNQEFGLNISWDPNP